MVILHWKTITIASWFFFSILLKDSQFCLFAYYNCLQNSHKKKQPNKQTNKNKNKKQTKTWYKILWTTYYVLGSWHAFPKVFKGNTPLIIIKHQSLHYGAIFKSRFASLWRFGPYILNKSEKSMIQAILSYGALKRFYAHLSISTTLLISAIQ